GGCGYGLTRGDCAGSHADIVLRMEMDHARARMGNHGKNPIRGVRHEAEVCFSSWVTSSWFFLGGAWMTVGVMADGVSDALDCSPVPSRVHDTCAGAESLEGHSVLFAQSARHGL